MKRGSFVQTGDYLLYKNEVKEVESYFGGNSIKLCNIGIVTRSELSEIILSNEVLTFVGFKFKPGYNTMSDSYVLETCGIRGIYYPFEGSLSIKSYKTGGVNLNYNIYYLHQLQQQIRSVSIEINRLKIDKNKLLEICLKKN